MSAMEAANLFNVKGMVFVITGGATGIGLMMTKAFAVNGAERIYIVGRRQEKLDEAAAQYANVTGIVGDVTSKDDLLRIAAQVKAETGHVNVLVANSGMLGPNPGVLATNVSVAEYAAKAMAMSMDDFTSTLEVNVTAVLFTTYAFMELLDAGNKKGGLHQTSQVIVTASIAAYNKAPATGIAYKASKAAAAHMAKNISSTLGPYHIRCNALAPGLFPSELASGMLSAASSKSPSNLGAFEASFIPETRAGDELDMGGTVLYLASRAGAYCNGTILLVDGGRLNMLPGY